MNIVDNAEAAGKYYTWEISGNRRMVGRWSLMAAFTYRWNQDNSGSYFGNAVRSYAVPRTPNDLTNTDTTDGAYKYRTWTVKFNSTIEAPWGLKLTPMLRHQAGQPWGRTFLGRFNYGSIRVLAEPIGTHRQDNITIFDLRAEKVFRLQRGYSVSGFVDIYNLFNANAAVNIIWSSGSSFQRPTTITPPRIVRFGAKFQW